MKQCRICLDEGGDLFSPCLCNGSVRYVHRECLATWIDVANNPARCTICHAEYLRDPPSKYALQPFCVAIEHKGLAIFVGNMGTAVTLGVSVTHFFNRLVNQPIVCIGIINALLIIGELLYAFTLAMKHRLNCGKTLFPGQCMVFLFLAGILGTPIVISHKVEHEFIISSSIALLMTFNFWIAAIFKCITQQINLQSNAFILPYHCPLRLEAEAAECKIR